MNDIMVSICCLTYNHEKYIRKALDGFIMQKTNFKFEVLIHDDASTDGTADIVREYESKYPDIIKPIYQTENQHSKGVRISRTYQYPRAKGKYIALCEGDDYWVCDTKLQQQVDIMEAFHNVSFCTHTVRSIEENGDLRDNVYPDKVYLVNEGLIYSEDFIRLLLTYKCPFQTSSYLVRSDVILNTLNDVPEYVKFFPTGDILIMWSCALAGDAYYIDKEFSRYRHNVPTSWTVMQRNNETHIRHYEKLIDAYKALEKSIDKKFHRLIRRKIKTFELNILNSSNKKLSFKDKACKGIFKMKPLVYKIMYKYAKGILSVLLGIHRKY